MCLVRYRADGTRVIAPCRLAGPDSDDPRRFLPGPGAVTEDDVRRARLAAREVLASLGVPPMTPEAAALDAAERERDRRFREPEPPPSVLRNLGKLGGQLKSAVRALTAELREGKWAAVPDPKGRGKRR